MRFIAALLSTLLVASPVFAADDKQDRLADRLTIGGATAFTVAYTPMTVTGTVLSAMSGGDPFWGSRTFTPVVGPFMLAGEMSGYQRSNETGLLIGLAVVDGIVQLGGIGLMVAGAVRQHRVNASVAAMATAASTTR